MEQKIFIDKMSVCLTKTGMDSYVVLTDDVDEIADFSVDEDGYFCIDDKPVFQIQDVNRVRFRREWEDRLACIHIELNTGEVIEIDSELNVSGELLYRNEIKHFEFAIEYLVGMDMARRAGHDADEFVVVDGALIAYNGNSEEVVIPEGVKRLIPYVFSGLHFKSVIFPESLSKIDRAAFHSCTDLRTIIFKEGLTVIGMSAFSACSSLTSISVPDGVTEIGDWAFAGCKGLKSVVIPDSVMVIKDRAFNACYKLTNATIQGSSTIVGNYVFNDCNNLTLHAAVNSPAEKHAKTNNIPFEQLG